MDIKEQIKNIEFIPILYDSVRQGWQKHQIDVSPEKYIEHIYKKKFHRNIDLNNPCTFNEKLNWMKLYWQDPLLTRCIDKYMVREYVNECGLGEILVNLYGVYDNIDDVQFNELPDKFVLKMNNGSGCNFFCRDKNNLKISTIKKQFRREFKNNCYYTYCEWGYKDITPKVICEQLIDTEDEKPPKDYKIFCFNGEPEYIYVASDRINHQTKFDFYTKEWKWLPVKNRYPNAGDILAKPAALDEMLDIARKLSKPFPEVRVDLYFENRRIYFGELTFYHMGGVTPFEPEAFDYEMGKKFDLPRRKIIRKGD
jgi:hypothetical protein